MSQASLARPLIAGISTCVPEKRVSNTESGFDPAEVRKVVSMAGVKERRVTDSDTCASDLCTQAGKALLDKLEWEPGSIDALIMVTQSPDYFLPSTACLIHRDLNLPDTCAAFDIGLGCSGYPYGLFVANSMLNSQGIRRILLCHGETPSKFPDPEDKATVLLFGDAGSCTAIEHQETDDQAHYVMHTDGSGYGGLIIRGGGFRNPNPDDPSDRHVFMDGAGIFNFTIKRVPKLIEDTFNLCEGSVDSFDQFIFHQSNRFIMKHLMKKAGLPEEKVAFTLEKYGNTGGSSIPLTITEGINRSDTNAAMDIMVLGYGVGLSWASATAHLPADITLVHSEYPQKQSQISATTA